MKEPEIDKDDSDKKVRRAVPVLFTESETGIAATIASQLSSAQPSLLAPSEDGAVFREHITFSSPTILNTPCKVNDSTELG